jgi:hypothetical protein
LRQAPHHFLNQQFRFRAGNQHGRVDLEFEAAKLLGSQDVLERFTRRPADNEGLQLCQTVAVHAAGTVEQLA